MCGFRSHQQLLRLRGLESDAPAFSPLFKTLEAGLQGGSHVIHIVLRADEAVEDCFVCKGLFRLQKNLVASRETSTDAGQTHTRGKVSDQGYCLGAHLLLWAPGRLSRRGPGLIVCGTGGNPAASAAGSHQCQRSWL